MIFIILGFIFGFGSFIAGLHYSHLKIEHQNDYRRYFRVIIYMRYLSVIFFIIGIAYKFLI